MEGEQKARRQSSRVRKPATLASEAVDYNSRQFAPTKYHYPKDKKKSTAGTTSKVTAAGRSLSCDCRSHKGEPFRQCPDCKAPCLRCGCKCKSRSCRCCKGKCHRCGGVCKFCKCICPDVYPTRTKKAKAPAEDDYDVSRRKSDASSRPSSAFSSPSGSPMKLVGASPGDEESSKARIKIKIPSTSKPISTSTGSPAIDIAQSPATPTSPPADASFSPQSPVDPAGTLFSPGSSSRPRLGNLARRFVSIIQSSISGTISVDEVAARLGVPKRRIYDVTSVLMGIGLIEKRSKNVISWKGFDAARKEIEEANLNDIVAEELSILGADSEFSSDDEEKVEGEAADGKKRKSADGGKIWTVNMLKEDIDRLFVEESILDTWIARMRELPHYTERPFLFCQAEDIALAAQQGKDEQQIQNLSTLAIRAPPGGVLEVHDPVKTHSNPKKRRYQLSVYNKTGIADLPLPPPPSGDTNFDAKERRERMARTTLDLGQLSGVGGISGNPVQVFHISRSTARTDNVDTGSPSMETDDDDQHGIATNTHDSTEPAVKLRKIVPDDTVSVQNMSPVGVDGDTNGTVTAAMMMRADDSCGRDALCLMEDEGASTFFT